MPRDGSGVYHTPAGTDGVPDTTIESSKYNTNVHDVETDLNTPRPIVAGGTGATNADAALLALSGEKAKQVVTNFNTMVWAPGSFYAATTATNSPVTSHAFAGAAYYNDVDNFVVEARDITDPEHKTYYRIQSAGVWGSWIDTTTSADARFVNVAGDTMTGTLVVPNATMALATMTGALTVVTPPVANTDASSKKYVDDSISALSSTIITQYVRYDTAQTLTATQQAQARSNTGTPNANVLINGDFRVNQTAFTAATSYVSGAPLAAGAYGHDQWKAGASGGDYSFTQLKSSTQITILSGKSLIQPIEDCNVVGGSYVLTWTGTAQARAGVNSLTPSGTYAASPLLITGQTAGTAMSVEFSAGTLGTVKLESGTIATPFVMRDYVQEFDLCRRYYQIGHAAVEFQASAVNQIGASVVSFSPAMRTAPTMTYAVMTGGGLSSVNWGGITPYGASYIGTSGSAGRMYSYVETFANARL